MSNTVSILRSPTFGSRPAVSSQPAGVPYVNFAERQFGVIDAGQAPVDLIGVTYFSPNANYTAGQPVVYQGQFYLANVAISAGPWNGANWTQPVKKTGDTMTGNYSINGSLTANSLTINGAATTQGLTATSLTVNGGSTVSGNSNVTGTLHSHGALSTDVNITCLSSVTYAFGGATAWPIGFTYNNSGDGLAWIWMNGGTAAYPIANAASDERMKQDISPSTYDCLTAVEQIPLYQYRWKDHSFPGGPQPSEENPLYPVGLIAQYMIDIVPHCVFDGNIDLPEGLTTFVPMTIQTNNLIATLIGAIQQLSARVRELEAKT